MNLLVGIIVGIFLALLVFGNLYLVGKQSSWKEAVKKATGDLYDAQALVGRFAYLEQERQKMKEHIQVNFTEDQITMLADRIGARVQTIMEAVQTEALKKMN